MVLQLIHLLQHQTLKNWSFMKHMPWEIMQIYHSTDQQKRTTKQEKKWTNAYPNSDTQSQNLNEKNRKLNTHKSKQPKDHTKTKFSKAQNVHSHMGEINTGIKKHTHTQIVGWKGIPRRNFAQKRWSLHWIEKRESVAGEWGTNKDGSIVGPKASLWKGSKPFLLTTI